MNWQDVLDRWTGSKFAGFVLSGLGLLLATWLVVDLERLKVFGEVLRDLFITYCSGNVLATAAGAVKDAAASRRQDPPPPGDGGAP